MNEALRKSGGDSVQPAVFIPYDVESAGHLRALGVERIAAYAVELMHAKLAEEEIPPGKCAGLSRNWLCAKAVFLPHIDGAWYCRPVPMR